MWIMEIVLTFNTFDRISDLRISRLKKFSIFNLLYCNYLFIFNLLYCKFWVTPILSTGSNDIDIYYKKLRKKKFNIYFFIP